MSVEQNEIGRLLKAFAQRPVAYQTIYSGITESVTAGLLLSQIVYWWYAVQEREFYKTDKDFRGEIGMGPREFKTAKSKLKKLNLVTMTRKGIPATTYYRLQVTELAAQISRWAETHQPDGSERVKCGGQYAPTIPDNTAEITSDKKREIPQRSLSEAEARDRAYRLLVQYGVEKKVATSMVFGQKVPLESIGEAVKNGLARQECERGFILEPGYIVAAINGARSEGKVVGATKLSKQFRRQIARKSRREDWTPPSKQECVRRIELNKKSLEIG
ncbi:MAG: hypothetical protein ACYS76_04375 [Planctomycetota bacterium]|jgi:hypothetical protein